MSSVTNIILTWPTMGGREDGDLDILHEINRFFEPGNGLKLIDDVGGNKYLEVCVAIGAFGYAPSMSDFSEHLWNNVDWFVDRRREHVRLYVKEDRCCDESFREIALQSPSSNNLDVLKSLKNLLDATEDMLSGSYPDLASKKKIARYEIACESAEEVIARASSEENLT